jgi:hypothetical protein
VESFIECFCERFGLKCEDVLHPKNISENPKNYHQDKDVKITFAKGNDLIKVNEITSL